MEKKDIKVIKKNIIKCLTEPDENENSFMRKDNYWNSDDYWTDGEVSLTTLMDYIVKGLYMSLEGTENN